MTICYVLLLYFSLFGIYTSSEMKLHAKIQSVCLVVLSYFTIIARSRMETIPLPRPLESCLQEKNWYRPTLTDEEAIGSCLVDYMWNNNRKCKSVSKDTVTWFGELAVNRSNHLRLNPIPKERKEYRVLSDDERNDYHKAVNLLKNNKEKHPNKYDAFVDFHRGIAGMAAHRGPAFLGWHRYFIFLYEQALQEEMPGVMLPYWDSTLDTEMSNPTDSVIWTNLFAGNGNGSVRTGPFSNWVASNGQRLTRAIGQGQLMDKQKVLDTLVNHAHHNTFGRDIESQHDSVHLWVGGHMSDIEVAPSDPMFFLHHAYIDCIWEQFRKRFRQPEDDYPNVRGIHAADKYMANLPKFPDDRSSRFGGNLLKNKDGYRNFWTERYYRCAPPPECSFRKPDCGSKWLECNVFTQRCVSKKSSAALPKITPEQMMKVMYQCYPDRKPANKAASETSIDTPTISYDMISEGESFYTYVIETQKTSSVHERKKRASIRNFSGFIHEVQTQRKHVAPTKQVQRQNDRNSFIAPPNAQIQIQWEKEVKNEPSHSKSDRLIQVQVKREPDEEVDLSTMSIDKFYIPEIDKPCDGYPIQNLFTADCKSDINLWVFVAVKVVHIRHGDVSYTTYEKMEGDGNFKEQDIYTEGEWIEFFNGRPLQKRPSIKKCHNDKSGLVKIRISSYGLNYDGTFSDNVFVDNRQPVTEAISFIAIKKPEMSSIEVLLTAVDQCGIACRAYCLPSKKQGQKPTYKECSGSIKFSAGSPNMYHKTYLDAAKNVWSESSSGILFSNENEIPIIFYCDYKDHRPTKLFGTTEG